MGISAIAAGNYILSLGARDGVPVSPMGLQKLVYIAHGWHLALRSEPLVTNEHPEAWDYGPVFPSLYYEFRSYGSHPIARAAAELVPDDDGSWRERTPTIPPHESVTRDIVDWVWASYRHLDGLQLSDLTHQRGSPWWQTRLGASGYRNTPIPRELIEDHFRDLAWKNRERRDAKVA